MAKPDARLERLADEVLDDLQKQRSITEPSRESEVLSVTGRVREVVRALIAYFLMYRYLDLTGTVFNQSGQVERQWGSPPTGDHAKTLDLLVQRVTAAPWFGGVSATDLCPALTWLLDTGVLEVALARDIPAAGAPTAGVAVLRMSEGFRVSSPSLQKRVEEAIAIARRSEVERAGLVEDLGTAIGAVGAFETYRLVAAAGLNDMIRIATYHLRTVVAGRDLAAWLADKPNLRVDIMCLGPTAEEGLTEGADPESLVGSLQDGIQSLKADLAALPRRQRRRVRVRIYGDVAEDSLFRGAILCGRKGAALDPKRVVVSAWPFGTSRANYGKVVILDGDSNLSRLLGQYYERAWTNAVPLRLGNMPETGRWVFRNGTPELVGAVASLVAAVLLLQQPDARGEAMVVLLGVVPALLNAIGSLVRRAGRAASLQWALRRRGRTAQ